MKETVDERVILGNNLLNLRLKACINGKMLADIAGIGDSTLFRLEATKSRFYLDTLQKVCNVYGITPEEAYQLDINKFSHDELRSTIEHYRRSNRKDVVSASSLNAKIEKFQGFTYYLNILIDEGFFIDFKTIGEVKVKLFNQFGVVFSSQQIANGMQFKKFFIIKKLNPKKSAYKLAEPRPYTKA